MSVIRDEYDEVPGESEPTGLVPPLTFFNDS